MVPAAFRFAAVAAWVFTAGAGPWLFAANEPPRMPPTRPSEAAATPPLARLAVVRIGESDYLDLDEAMARLGLKSQPRDATRKLVFADKSARLVLEPESREALVNGLRVFLGDKIAGKKGKLYVSRIDFERTLIPLFRPALIGALPEPPKIIAIDPGHGGPDNGMENAKLGLKEKDFTLDVALRLKKLLEAAGYAVVMTRKEDWAFSADKKKDLPHRALVANNARAALFVSIHFNSLYPDTKTNGTEIYIYTRQNQRSDQSWGVGEEDDTRRETMAVNRFDAWSSLLAQQMHREVLGQLGTSDRGQKTKHLLVLQDLNCPAVLVESVFLSNDAEARRAATPAYRQKIAQAVADGVSTYSSTLESLRPKTPVGTAAAPGTSNSR